MRIALTMEQCWHDVPGGTAAAAIDLAAALDSRGDVEVVGVAARHPEPPDPPWQPGVTMAHSRLPRLALYEAWHGLRRPRLEGLVDVPVDVVHGTGSATPPTRGPLVVTVHDLAFRHFPDMFTRHGRRFLNRAFDLARRTADRIVVPSEATRDDCLSAGVDEDRCAVVPWGVRTPDISDDDRAAARHLVGDAEGYVVVVGTLEPRKNLRRLLDAWSRLDRPDLRLVVVGPAGWGDAFGGHRPDGVVLAGFVPTAVRDALYADARLSVYPSIFEGFGLPVLESMAAGCPVVTAAGTASAELLANGGGRAVDVTDVDALAAAIDGLVDDETTLAELAGSARMQASTYTWERTAADMVGHYRDVLR